MRFWDSSGVVPLLVEQAASIRAAEWIAEDERIVLWTLTPVEVVSALRRLVREKAASDVVVDIEAVKSLATRLLRLHPLHAFDALQLGAALQGRRTATGPYAPHAGQPARARRGARGVHGRLLEARLPLLS